MENYCANCGTAIPEGSDFCPVCGTATQKKLDANNILETVKKNKKKVLISIVAIVLVIVLFAALFGGNSPKKIANTYLKAVYKTGNGNSIAKILPKDYIKYVMDEEDVKKKEIIEALDENCEDSIDHMEDTYDDCKISWKIKEVKDAKKSEAKEYIEWYEDELDLKVKKVKKVEAEVTIKYKDDGDKEEEDFDTVIYVVKIGGKWYLDTDYAPMYNL